MILAGDFDGRTVFDWWLKPKQRTQFPLLSRMAVDIYSISATSSEAERVFSGANYTVSDHRNSLKSRTLELFECSESWFRTGLVTEEDVQAIVRALDEYEDLEAEEAVEP